MFLAGIEKNDMNLELPAGTRNWDKFHKTSEIKAEAFKPEADFNQYEAIKILKRIGTGQPKHKRWSNSLIRHIELMVAHTRLKDWHDRLPVVWMSVAKIGEHLGISCSQVRKNERRLLELGAISFQDSGNHKRFGKRGPDGKIIEAYGINLAPLGYLLDSLRCDLAEITARRDERDRLKRSCSAFRQKIKASLFNLFIEGDDGGYDRLKNAFETLIEDNKSNHSSTLEQLKYYYAALSAFYEQLSTEDNSQITSNKSVNTDTRVSKNGDQGAHKRLAHIIQTDKQIKNNTGRNQSVDKSSSEIRISSTVQPVNGREERRSQISEAVLCDKQLTEEKKADFAHFEKTFTMTNFVNGLPDDLKSQLPPSPDWQDMETLADDLRHEMGISVSTWQIGQKILGFQLAPLSMIIVYLRWRTDIVYKPGGYFRGMIKKGKKGDLHLMPSIYGLVDGRNKSFE